MVDADRYEIDSYITLEEGGDQFSLYIPSGSNTGLKLNRPFTITAGGQAHFVIDFDLRKSIHNPGNNSNDYMMRPTLRILDMTEVGTISGTIEAAAIDVESCADGDGDNDPDGLAVYLYTGIGTEVTPDDEGSPTSPLTSTVPVYNADTDSYDYQLSFLLAGDYTVALTCDADEDDPEVDEPEELAAGETGNTWSALDIAEATVVVNETTIVDFTATSTE